MSWEVPAMKSKTSFFNLSLLRKDIVRFAPAWVLYGAFLILVFSGNVLGGEPAYVAQALGDSVQPFSLLNLAYGLLCAQLLFGDLHNSRMCNALHALPIRRESWFLTHTAAGVLFTILPVALAGLVFLAVLGKFWLAALLWMAALILQYLFFFAVGTLSMILTGNRFASLVVYTIINFIAGIVLWLFYALYAPHLHGLAIDPDPWLVLCPVVEFAQQDWFTVISYHISSNAHLEIWGGWGYLGICSGVALVVLAGALLLYRKRPLEAAGDFLAFRPLQPVFLVLYTFSAGAALHLFSQIFIGASTEMAFLLVGLAIGFITGLMLLKRTLRVFRLRALAHFAAIVAVFGLSLLLTVFDPFGITRWTPDVEDVECVTLDRMYASREMEYAITDPALIEQIISVHQHGIENRNEGDNGVADVQVTIRYTMKNGGSVAREYYIDTNTVAATTLKYVLSQPENIFGTKYPTAEALLETVTSIAIYDENGEENVITDPQQLRQLVEAMYADAKEGNLVQDYVLYHGHGTAYSMEVIGGRVPIGDGGYYWENWYIHYTVASRNLFELTKPLIP